MFIYFNTKTNVLTLICYALYILSQTLTDEDLELVVGLFSVSLVFGKTTKAEGIKLAPVHLLCEKHGAEIKFADEMRK